MISSRHNKETVEPARCVVLCDFDGTISRQDVGNRLFATFASSGWKHPVQDWISGKISSRDCLLAECSLARATREQVTRFVLGQRIDPYFKRFLHFCRRQHIPVIILSDGLDFYIDLILKKYGLEDLPRYANHLVFQGSRLVPSFPYFEQGCGSCGNCKGFHVRRFGQDGRTTIYIGDGYSDKCAVQDADLVFAKGDLRRYCRQHGIEHIPYCDFNDVLRRIRLLVGDVQHSSKSQENAHSKSGKGIVEKQSHSKWREH